MKVLFNKCQPTTNSENNKKMRIYDIIISIMNLIMRKTRLYHTNIKYIFLIL